MQTYLFKKVQGTARGQRAVKKQKMLQKGAFGLVWCLFLKIVLEKNSFENIENTSEKLFLLSKFKCFLCSPCFFKRKKKKKLRTKRVLCVFLVFLVFQNKKQFSKPVNKQVLCLPLVL